MLYYERDKNLYIDFEKSIFSKNFFEEFYELQKMLDTKEYDTVHLDLSKSIWIDLMCLSYLVLTFIKNKEKFKSTFKMSIFNEKTKDDLEHIRLVNYLKTNSVFDVFSKYLQIDIKNKQIEEITNDYKETLINSEFQLTNV